MLKEDPIKMNTSYNYKQFHESLMQNHNGTTIWENILIITPAPILVYFICLFSFCVFQFDSPVKLKRLALFVIEFVTTVCFLILNFTFLSEYNHITVTVFIVAFVSFIIYYMKKVNRGIFRITRKRIAPRSYFTNFRSIISLMTCICILAVDFHIFPRRYAKTENFGYGLMDTGVGFYVVANGIVVKPLEKKSLLKKSIISSLPIILLGVIRYLSLQSMDYQQHISEYGVHWNFFFTLAFVKLAATLLLYKYPTKVVFLSIVTATLHQIILFFITQKWVLEDSSRSNFINANKEGLASLPGYISLYLSAVALGKFLSMPVVTLFDDLRHGLNVFIWSIIFLSFTLTFELIFGVSRRLANITYITWMLTMSLYGLSLCIFTEFALRISLQIKNENNERLMPSIFQAVNYNSLLFFLLSNILTGIVNLMFHTFHADHQLSFAILIFYQLYSCGIIYLLFMYKIKLKFW